jgi:hypothetical protein
MDQHGNYRRIDQAREFDNVRMQLEAFTGRGEDERYFTPAPQQSKPKGSSLPQGKVRYLVNEMKTHGRL